jgi:integrase
VAKVAKRRDRYVLDFYDCEGNRKRVTMPNGTTKKAATEKLREIEMQLSKGIYIPEKKTPTFAEVAQEWLQHKKTKLRASTWSVYEGHSRNHFNEFNHLKINHITTAKVDKFITDRQADGMNILTLRKILVSMGQIFSLAVRYGYISSNPLDNAERPRKNGNEEDDQDKIQVLTHEEIAAFLNVVKDQKYRMLFMLAIFSGARQGELLGLEWKSVNWKDSQININRTFNNGKFYTPKTKASKRKIDIGPTVLAELKEWKVVCPESSLDLVFATSTGKPINHNNITKRHFEPALIEAGAPKIRFHDMRHTFASLLIEQGENIKYIQTQLGHSSPTVTLNVYAHLMKPVNQAAACRLEDAIFATGHRMVTK